MSVHNDSPNLQVKLENEKEIFYPDYKLPESPESSLPYRKIWDVSFYNNKAELVSLSEITKSGPFVGVASAEKSEGVREHYKNRNYKISLHPVLEYSLELPYGRQALVWITTETACYRIMSISANYIYFWQPFYEKVCFSGHVVNILLNYRGPLLLVKLIVKVAKLSGKTADETYELLKTHRKFIQDLLKDQNLSSRIRKEYNLLQSYQSIWDLSWEDHLKNTEKKPERFGKMNIMSFFRPKASNENGHDSLNSSASPSLAKRSSGSLDETSSLLSISEDESAIYIESPYDLVDDELDRLIESGIKNYIASSFTSSKFLKWNLKESESLNGSFYNCPLCNVTFKTKEKDCISAFCIHLKAHRADYKNEEYHVNDFENRFNYFRNDLNALLNDQTPYIDIPLVFDKNINNKFSSQFITRPFAFPCLLENEESVTCFAGSNPIKVLKFGSNVVSKLPSIANLNTAPSSAATSNSISSAVVAPKKPRAKKASIPKSNSATQPLPSSSIPNNGGGPESLNSKISETVLPTTSVDPIPAQTVKSYPLFGFDLSVSSHPNAQSHTESDSSNQESINLKSQSESETPMTNTQNNNKNSLSSITSTNTVEATPTVDSKNLTNFEIVSQPSFCFKRPFSDTIDPYDILLSEEDPIPQDPQLDDKKPSFWIDGKQFGCNHYKINCKFYSECCKKWFTCRFCHDEVSDHKMNRHETRFCLCMFCGKSQKAAGRCSNQKCLNLLAHYFCDKCKFWDNDSNKLIYHCDKCEICRTGLRSNYEHCDKCEKCVAKSAFLGHQCGVNSIKSVSSPYSTVSSNLAPLMEPIPMNQSNAESNTKITLNTQAINPQKNNNFKIDDLLIGNKNCSPQAANVSNNVQIINNNLQNHYWKGLFSAIGTRPDLEVKQQMSRKCWNCLNTLLTNSDGSLRSKYCTFCSAIVE